MEATINTQTVKTWDRYPSYRTIETDWLHEIPKHWEFKRLKWTIAGCQNGIWGDEPTGEDDDLGCVRVADFDRDNHVVGSDIELTKRSVPISKREGRTLQRGDLLLEKSGGGDLQPVGALVLFDSDAEAVCSNFVAKVSVAPSYSSRYLCYLHAALYSGKINTRSMKQSTGIQNLDSDQYFGEHVGLPPLPEQRAIAAFLDRETARIDALVGHKQRLIELLEEKRQAVISHAVTKGLDPSVEMKNSGVDWLGHIPFSWETTRLKYPVELLNGYAFPSDGYVQEGIPVLRIGDVKSKIDWNEVKRVPEDSFDKLPHFQVKKGDVLLAMTGATIGKSSVFDYEVRALLNQRVGILRAKDIAQEFLSYVVASSLFKEFIDLLCYGGAQENIGKSDIGGLPVCIPPASEQNLIVKYLDAETLKIGRVVEKIADSISHLQEYRTALISAAVTGQIDVRDEVQLDD